MPWSHLFSTSLTMHKRGCIKTWNLYWLASSCVGIHHLKSLDTYTLLDLVISVTSFPHNGQLYSLHQSSPPFAIQEQPKSPHAVWWCHAQT